MLRLDICGLLLLFNSLLSSLHDMFQYGMKTENTRNDRRIHLCCSFCGKRLCTFDFHYHRWRKCTKQTVTTTLFITLSFSLSACSMCTSFFDTAFPCALVARAQKTLHWSPKERNSEYFLSGWCALQRDNTLLLLHHTRVSSNASILNFG